MDRILENIVALTTAPRTDDLTSPARHAAKRMLLDALGCAFGGYREDVPRVARELASRRAQETGARILGSQQRVSPDMAAFANGVAVRYLDFNDTYGSTVGVGHPSDYIPAILAAAELRDAAGATVLDAITVSYEVFCRLTDVTRLGVEHWDHVVNGAVASAAGACYVLDLPADLMRHAISLSLVPNVALQATRLNDVSRWKGCASANAARNGVFAVELALAGITGPAMPFEGRGGLFSAIGSAADIDAWARDRPAILDCNIKRFPAGYFSQGAIQAAIDVRQDLPDSRQITKVEVGTFAFGKRVMAGDAEKWRPETRETADHSLPYVVASALANGTVTRDSFTTTALRDPETVRLLGVLTVTEDPECERAWPEACMNKVTVHLRDGSRLTSHVRHYRGHSAQPMSDAEVEEKFHNQALPVIGAESARRLAEAVWTLDVAPGVDPLFKACTAPPLDAGP